MYRSHLVRLRAAILVIIVRYSSCDIVSRSRLVQWLRAAIPVIIFLHPFYTMVAFSVVHRSKNQKKATAKQPMCKHGAGRPIGSIRTKNSSGTCRQNHSRLGLGVGFGGLGGLMIWRLWRFWRLGGL